MKTISVLTHYAVYFSQHKDFEIIFNKFSSSLTHLHIELGLDHLDVGCLVVGLRLAGSHHGHLEGDEQRGGEPDEGPGPLHALQTAAQRHLVGLLRGIGAVRIGEVDVGVGVVHDALDVVGEIEGAKQGSRHCCLVPGQLWEMFTKKGGARGPGDTLLCN